jgi:hypothetical protein
MEVAGSTLMASAPSRPRQSAWHVARSRPDEVSEQMAHFRDREGQDLERQWLGWRLGDTEQVGCFLTTHASKVSRRQHDQRHVPVPPKKAAHFIVIQAHVFRLFKIFLTMPAGANGLHHLVERGSRRGKDEVIALLLRVGDGTTDEQEVVSIIFPLVQDRDGCPVKEPGAFGPLTHRKALPVLLMQHERFHVAHFHAAALSVRGHDPNGFIAGHGQHRVIRMRFQPGPQIQVAAIDRISHDPGNGATRLLHALEHLDRQFWLGLEAHRLRNMGGATAIPILAPVQGQIQLTVNQGMSTRRDVAQKDPNLTILDLPGGSTLLQPHASRLGAPFGKTAFINDQDRRLLAQLLQHVAAHLIAHAMRIPDGA